MNKLTFRIKPNDEITLKENLHDYCENVININKGVIRRLKHKEMCKDPNYCLDYYDKLLFSGKTVSVTFTRANGKNVYWIGQVI